MITKCGALGRTDMLPYLIQATEVDSLYVDATIAATSIKEGFLFPISGNKSSNLEDAKMKEYIKYVNNILEKWQDQNGEDLAKIAKDIGLRMGLKGCAQLTDEGK